MANKFNFDKLAEKIKKQEEERLFGKYPLPVCPEHHVKPKIMGSKGSDTVKPMYCCDKLKELVKLNLAKR